MSQPEMPESVTDGDTPEDLLIDATDHPDGLDSELPPTAVDGVIDNLIDAVMQPALPGGADIHAGTLANGLQAF